MAKLTDEQILTNVRASAVEYAQARKDDDVRMTACGVAEDVCENLKKDYEALGRPVLEERLVPFAVAEFVFAMAKLGMLDD